MSIVIILYVVWVQINGQVLLLLLLLPTFPNSNFRLESVDLISARALNKLTLDTWMKSIIINIIIIIIIIIIYYYY